MKRMKIKVLVVLALAFTVTAWGVAYSSDLDKALDEIDSTVDEIFDIDDEEEYYEPDDAMFAWSELLYVRYDMNKQEVDEGYPKLVDENTWNLKLNSVDAVLNWGNGKVYFFDSSGDEDLMYVRWDIEDNRVDEGYPKSVNSNTWPGLDFWYMTGVVNWGNGKAYFVGYNQDETLLYSRYDIKSDEMDSGYPNVMDSSNWDKMNLQSVTAALNNWKGKAYIFGTLADEDRMYYVRYDTKTNKMDPGYPKLVYGNWKGVSEALDEITAAVDWGNGKAYIFGYKVITTQDDAP